MHIFPPFKVFTTTHKAKGLEWKTVVLLDDFFDIPGAAFPTPRQENLLYHESKLKDTFEFFLIK